MADAYRAYRDSVLALQGQSLARVAYVTGSAGDEPDWNWASADFDQLDQGVELETETGAQFAILRDWTFACYGLAVVPGAFTQHLVADADVGSWDVSASANWQPVLHTPIDDVVIYWLWSWERINGEHVKVPYTLEFSFRSGQRIYVVAAQYHAERDDLFPMTEDVAVIWDERIARRYGIGPDGEAERLA